VFNVITIFQLYRGGEDLSNCLNPFFVRSTSSDFSDEFSNEIC
jgi:hypothetical protein